MHLCLTGCRAEPLAGYLKALGIFRLLAEQKEPAVSGTWQGGVFVLNSRLNRDELLHFFVDEYRPTPIVAPWNKGSGFYEGDKRNGIDAIIGSSSPRFAIYRETIERVFRFPELPSTGVSIGKMLMRLVEHIGNMRPGKARERLHGMVETVKFGLERLAIALTSTQPAGLTVEDLADLIKDLPSGDLAAAKLLLREAKKVRTEFKKLSCDKKGIPKRCRTELGDEFVDWLDAAVLLGSGSEYKCPPILGTGGNEGRLDYTNNFMQHLANIFISPNDELKVRNLLCNVLFGEPADGLVEESGGKFDPGRAGGYNQGMGVKQEKFPINPWDFILTMEGTVAWSGSVTRRLGSCWRGNRFASPFTVRARNVGYVSAADSGEAEAEVWTPLWEQWVTYPEVRALLAEGRADVGRRQAGNTIDFAEATSSLGVDRGIKEFVRFSLVKRRSDSSYLALPAGRFPVRLRMESDLVREMDKPLFMLDSFLNQFRRKEYGGGIPSSLAKARRRIDEAVFDLLLGPTDSRVREVVAALGRMEQLLDKRDPGKKPKLSRPLSGLSPLWIKAAGTDCLEVRIAAAVASISAFGSIAGPLRCNLAPVNPRKPWEFSAESHKVAWTGNSLPRRLAAVLERRLLEAERSHEEGNPLKALLFLAPEDVSAFLARALDETLLEELLFGFSLVEWGKHTDTAVVKESWTKRSISDVPISRTYALLKLLFLPHPLARREGSSETVNLRPSGNILPLLLSGRVNFACETAQHRLFASGFTPLSVRLLQGTVDGTRLAGALLIPVRGAKRLARMVCDYEPLKIY